MGIFSIFKGKKNEETEDPVVDARARGGESTRMGDSDTERARQREIARATAAKIDAIESAMASDIFNTPEPAWGSGAKRTVRIGAKAVGDNTPHPTLPMLELATTELLADDEVSDAPLHATTAPVIEEIAIMYANDELEVAEHLLLESLADVGQTDRTVWWMLFDLYQVSGRQDDFDNVAIDYASRFETSPPSWSAPPPAGTDDNTARSGVTPTEAFTGALDAAIAPQLKRLLGLAGSSPLFRLEFGRVKSATPEGCTLILGAMKDLRAGGGELIVAGASELADIIRANIATGERDASEAPWLLLLALLQLMNKEKDFEETAMDYCVTYEVSPPSFEAPANMAAAAEASVRTPSTSDRFMLPPLIDGFSTTLFEKIEAYAEQYDPVVLDCSRLGRVDYSAASSLLSRLRPLHAADKRIEFRDMNHLVAALFKLLGYPGVSRLFPHKY
ncbi:STAS domain-containing protein [Massilia glaciei]|uniref:STAS domain-containing protein n=1 Tax=Massilia glaciei TaxID=1524097 RepID=A0A2U2I5Z9_9BURK|nr:STAS domain-containing protein [Massilia glaciei]PWF55142.1 STAS domain-containing protein [Massilia glaciei]